ncbi:hypothetical protein HanIR_Chr10g0488201 [Helianthus annuus]|nr:hypothetical protein HanIR_Chr10g0488201 [Helianthus annuus]
MASNLWSQTLDVQFDPSVHWSRHVRAKSSIVIGQLGVSFNFRPNHLEFIVLVLKLVDVIPVTVFILNHILEILPCRSICSFQTKHLNLRLPPRKRASFKRSSSKFHPICRRTLANSKNSFNFLNPMQKTYGTLSAVERERLAIHESFESTHWWLRRCMLTCS